MAAIGPCLLADIGGTNARFGLLDGVSGAAHDVARLAVSDYPSCEAAIADYLSRSSASGSVSAAAIAIAGPVTDGRATLTNATWAFDEKALSLALDGARVRLLNDFEALAWSLPALTAEEVFVPADWPTEGAAGAPMALMGPGTGLGVAGLVPLPGGGHKVLVTEGGHVSLPATSAREAELIEVLRGRFGHVSAERLLSGFGLENLAWAFRELDPDCQSFDNAAEITEAALAGQPHGSAILEQFCAWLGVIAGNLVLSLGARGGLYIGGGILPRVRDFWSNSSFRAQFEAKGRFAGYLRPIPCRLIVADDTAFIGLARAARDLSAEA